MNKIGIVLLLALVVLTACSTAKKPTKGLRIGVMPAVDSTPIFVAEKLGYFEELGLDVEIEVYTNAMNRQSALQSGELDGAMTDVIALVNNVENGFDIRVTTSTDGIFPVLAHSGAFDKKSISVGMMEVSVTNYLADELLSDYAVEKEYINEIPARLEMVGSGTLDMAVIPEPMASMGALNGLDKKVLVSNDEYSPDVMVFNASAIDAKEDEIQRFHDAYNKAVDEINTNDTHAREILIDRLQLNPAIKDDFGLPKFNHARIPSEAYFKKIIAWNQSVLKIDVNVTYEQLIDARFVQ